MNRYVVTLSSATSTRRVTVAADGLIAARIVADQKFRKAGEHVVTAMPYESLNKIVVK